MSSSSASRIRFLGPKIVSVKGHYVGINRRDEMFLVMDFCTMFSEKKYLLDHDRRFGTLVEVFGVRL